MTRPRKPIYVEPSTGVRLESAGGDRVTFVDPQAGTTVTARLRESEGRWEVIELTVVGEPIVTNTLRDIRLGHLDVLINLPAVSAKIAKLSTSEAVARFIPKISDTFSEGPGVARVSRDRHPDSLYEDVAREYVELVSTGERGPAQIIADNYGTAVTTAHRWIREARLRGLLPPARPGKAG